MKFLFPRYIHGMLQTPDKKNVFGDIRPIAYSEQFSLDLQRQVYQKIRPGLTRELFQDSSDAYGFFALNEKEYIAAHFQLMELTEPTSRGKPIFSEYLYITDKQLIDFDWNLFPIFQQFKPIDFYGQINKNLDDLEIDIPSSAEWFNYLRAFQVQLQATLVRYLSSSERVIIASAPVDNQIRLKFFCAFLQSVPKRYRHNISFATLASDTTETVKLFFSARHGRYGQIVDWVGPTVPTDQPGAIYATWVDDLISQGDKQKMNKAIANLLLPDPAKATHLKLWGEQLDLAVRSAQWYPHREDYLRTKIPQQLMEQADQILKFSCIYSEQQIADWLSTILTYLIKLNAYDIGTEALAKHTSLLGQDHSRRDLVQKIVHLTLEESDDSLPSLVTFIIQVTEYAKRSGQTTLIEFCKEILFFSLSLSKYQRGLNLWVKIAHLSWTTSPDFISAALEQIHAINSSKEFLFIIEDIGCPANKKAFTSLLALLKRSPINIPAAIKFLEQSANILLANYFENMQKCFQEIESYRWLSTQIHFAIQNYPDLVAHFPNFLAKMPFRTTEKLLDYVAKIKDGRQIALISFSIMRNGINSANPASHKLFIKSISFCQNCSSDEIKFSLPILSVHWDDFPYEQLLLIQNLLKQKSSNLDNSAQEIQTVLNHHERRTLLEQKFHSGVDTRDLDWIVQELIPNFIKANDVDAWAILVNNLRERTSIKRDYQESLGRKFLESQAFGVSFYHWHKWQSDLERKGLLFEADLFAYWLIRSRDQKVDISPTISRTLKSRAVNYFTAGKIIGYERAIDNTYLRLLVQSLMFANLRETQSLGEELSEFISRHSESSIQIRIKSLIADIEPDVVWVEFCKTILSQIRLEFNKANKRRN